MLRSQLEIRRVLLFVMLSFLAGFSLCSHSALAEEVEDSRLKSEKLAWVLALDPLPGDALFYAGRVWSGLFNSALGIISGMSFIAAILEFDRDGCAGDDPSAECTLDIFLMAAMGASYVGMLAWDGVNGMAGVCQYNEQIRQQSTSATRYWIKPSMQWNNQGVIGSLTVNF